jgi:hypothetical protein
MTKNIKWLVMASLVVLASCNKNDDEIKTNAELPLTAGSANFANYVALGNSITAGFSDNALFKAGQENAYPKLMADQFATVGGGAFKIPFMNDNVGGLLFGGNVNPKFGPRLIYNGVGPVPLPGAASTTETFAPLTGPFNNMGVPGAKSFHLLAPGYGSAAGLATQTANPYFVRFASGATASVLSDAMAQKPTFFSLWIGNNDVLGYALSGGDDSNPITPVSGAPGVGFDGTYTALVTTLTSGGAKGVVANIPYVSTIPFFTTVPTNALPKFSKTDGAGLNGLFVPLDQILTALGQPDRFVDLSVDDEDVNTKEPMTNPLLIKDESLTDFSAQITGALIAKGIPAPQAGLMGTLYGQARHARNESNKPTERDFILLPSRNIINTVQANLPASFSKIGITYPLQDSNVLTADENSKIVTATDAYNATIKSLADAKGLGFVDANGFLKELASPTGIRFGNYQMTSSFVAGGAFGLDGVHLTARANAYVANKFMEAINKTYGSTLRMYQPENFPISYPTSLK